MKEPKGKWCQSEMMRLLKDKEEQKKDLTNPRMYPNRRRQPAQPEEGKNQPEPHKIKSLPKEKVQDMVVKKKVNRMNIKPNIS